MLSTRAATFRALIDHGFLSCGAWKSSQNSSQYSATGSHSQVIGIGTEDKISFPSS